MSTIPRASISAIWRNALTYGVDAFQDNVKTSDSRGNSNITTPGGLRTVSGGFVQLKNNYSTWLEVVSAIRYDHYDLEFGNRIDGRRSSSRRRSPSA